MAAWPIYGLAVFFIKKHISDPELEYLDSTQTLTVSDSVVRSQNLRDEPSSIQRGGQVMMSCDSLTLQHQANPRSAFFLFRGVETFWGQSSTELFIGVAFWSYAIAVTPHVTETASDRSLHQGATMPKPLRFGLRSALWSPIQGGP